MPSARSGALRAKPLRVLGKAACHYRGVWKMSEPKRGQFNAKDLTIIARATHEPVIVGDFVQLASGGPLGVVASVEGEIAAGTWLNDGLDKFEISWVCLKPIAGEE